ncbi:hypothetical protein QBC46DRAFT_453816 [Diplogelasinospora grovesii]|uniref:Uncharacterized protein n=1 Tax=Diplogelasinospora grovesii TaxID=303347 RepID=A0AAN6RZJ0_9PEZI|nr:hypothetical protein QBC46DRAFT_453816 [Diplogelasinospora grovesii]
MCWSPQVPKQVYNSGTFKAAYNAVHESPSHHLTRVWCIVMYICSLGLGLPLVLSCYSTQTANLHLYAVDTYPFLSDFLSINNTDTRSLGPQLSHANLTLLPQTYYFGVSGVCRDSNVTGLVCTRSFPVTYSIPEVIFSDLVSFNNNITLPANFTMDTQQDVINSMSRATAALLVTSMAWAFLTTILVISAPGSLAAQAVPLIILAVVTLGAWLNGNVAFLQQDILFNMSGTDATAGPGGDEGGLLLGPGFGIFIGYLVSILALTPMLAFWSIVVAVILVTLAVVIAIELAILLVILCVACAGSTQNVTYYQTSS